jgi:periplasmic protein TonB
MRYFYLFGFFSIILALAFKMNSEELQETRALEDKETLRALVSEIAAIEAEEKPLPELGYEYLKDFVKQNLRYPEDAKNNKIEGNVYLELTIDSSGTVINIKTIKGIGFGCDQEAERLLMDPSIKWRPGLTNNEPVKTRIVLAVLFRIS